jgi:CRISPR/Cas system-associated exonuclease Cas4 (RecB family)
MYISTTAIELYEECPRRFKIERRDRRDEDNASDGARLGRVLHSTLERLVKEHKKAEVTDVLDLARATEIYEEEWTKEGHITGQENFTEGLQMIHDEIQRAGVIPWHEVAGVEERFKLPLADTVDLFDGEEDDITLVGVIDRLNVRDIVDEETGEVEEDVLVLDYKSTREFLTARDAHESIQLSAYALYAQSIYPNAKRIRAGLILLRSSSLILTTRTPEQLEDFRRYARAMARRIAADEEWAPQLNPRCIYCMGRRDCPAYKAVLDGDTYVVCEDTADLDAVAAERQALAERIKIMKKRQEELDGILKAHLLAFKDGMSLAGRFWRMTHPETKVYPLAETIGVISAKTGMRAEELMERFGVVQKKSLDAFIKGLKQKGAETTMIQASLENIALRSRGERLYHRKEKTKKEKP